MMYSYFMVSLDVKSRAERSDTVSLTSGCVLNCVVRVLLWYVSAGSNRPAEPRLESRERSARLGVTVTESESALQRQRLSRYSADHSNLLQHGRHIDTMSLAGHQDVMLSQRIQAVDLPPRT